MTDTMAEFAQLLDRLVSEAVERAIAASHAVRESTEPGCTDLINVESAAARLAVSRTTVYALMGAGELPFVQIGSKRGIAVEDLRSYIDRHRVVDSRSQRTRQGSTGSKR